MKNFLITILLIITIIAVETMCGYQVIEGITNILNYLVNDIDINIKTQAIKIAFFGTLLYINFKNFYKLF